MNKKIILGLGSSVAMLTPIVSVVACNESKDESSKNYRSDFVAGNSWYTNAAEKDAMTMTLYNQAQTMFDELSKQSGFDLTKVDKTTGVVSNSTGAAAVPVVFMDLDETVLDNIAYQNWNLVNGTGFSPKTWTDWVAIGQANKIKGAISFIKHVWNNGGVVMFNSDRNQSQWTPTRQNLIDLGLDAKYLPSWVSWMQGIDPEDATPWTIDDHAHTKKETRMDKMNSSTYDLSASIPASGNTVHLKTVMRVGDNLNDFNDLAYKGALNADRKAALKNIGSNFGSTSTVGHIYDAANNTWINEGWNEGYVLIGGNSSYGGWEEGLAKGYYGLKGEEQSKARLKSITTSKHWDGKKEWKRIS